MVVYTLNTLNFIFYNVAVGSRAVNEKKNLEEKKFSKTSFMYKIDFIFNLYRIDSMSTPKFCNSHKMNFRNKQLSILKS